jgi:hypothetical protein
MPLPAGIELGTHRLLALIGVGSMGEAYKEHDTKLLAEPPIWLEPTHVINFVVAMAGEAYYAHEREVQNDR